MRASPFILLAAVTLLAGCDDRGDRIDAGPELQPVSFQGDILPIFTSSCALSGCHVEPTPTGNMILESGRAYSQTVDVPSRGHSGWIRVQPREPEESLLYRKLVATAQDGIGERMPASGSVTEAQIELIRRWIAEGAAY